MNRPRVAGIVSGIAASVAAFLVVSRWNLAGTLTGAAIMPVIYILVSHSSLEGLDGLGRWTRRRLRDETNQAGEREATPPAASESAVSREDTEAENDEPLPGRQMIDRRVPERTRSRAQWVLAGVACLALGLSICSVVLRAPAEETIVRETVVEKTVTVPMGAAPAVALGSGDDTAETTTSGEPGSGGTGGASDTTAEPGAQQPDGETDTSSTTGTTAAASTTITTPTTSATAPGSSDQEDPPSPATTAVPTVPTSRP